MPSPRNDRRSLAQPWSGFPTARVWSRIAAPLGKPWIAFGLHVCLLIIFTRVAFGANRAFLLYSLDGAFMRVVAQNQWVLGDLFSPVLDMNLLQSVGNVWYPFKVGYIPAYLASLIWTGGRIDSLLCYPVFAAELFVATYAMARSWRSSSTTAILGGWIAALAAMPILGLPSFYPLTAIVPHMATLIASGAILVALVGTIGRFDAFASLVSAGGIIIVTLWAVVASPAAFVVIVPFAGIFALASVAAAETRSERLWKAAALGLCAALLAVAGPAKYLAGLFGYTAAAFWPNEDLRSLDWFETSGLLHTFFGWTGPGVMALGIVGACTAMVLGPRTARVNGFALIASLFALMAWGVLWFNGIGGWSGPRPAYLEAAFWPPIAIFAASLIKTVLDGVERPLQRVRDGSGAIMRQGLAATCFLGGLGAVLAYSHPTPRDPFLPRPARTEITGLLADRTALSVGAPFRGRVASIAGYEGGDRDSWVEQVTFDARLVAATGNDHRLTGLPYFQIPILTEYGSFRTPAYSAVAGRLLSVPQASRRRGIAVITRVNAPLMRALGVRFALTSQPLEASAKPLRRLDFGKTESLYLYELSDINLGDYSPTRSVLARTATEALGAMSADMIDFRRDVIASEPLPSDLVPATNASMIVLKGGLRVTAHSAGRSVLLLPIEFSHCLVLNRFGSATLFRANVMQAGLLFTGGIDVEVRLDLGPLRRAGCRLEDVSEARRFGLQDVRFDAP